MLMASEVELSGWSSIKVVVEFTWFTSVVDEDASKLVNMADVVLEDADVGVVVVVAVVVDGSSSENT